MPLDFPAPDPHEQLALRLHWQPRMTRRAWRASTCNADALAMIEGRAEWPNGRLALVGEEGCGKSHLGAIWRERLGATRLDIDALTETSVRDLVQHDPLVLEDADRFFAQLLPKDRRAHERGLHHLLNIMLERRKPILITARTPPARWEIELRDLRSRLSSISVFQIARPDAKLIPGLMAKLFHDRSMTVSWRVTRFLATRSPRSYSGIAEVVDLLDRASIARGRPVSVDLAKEVLGW